MSEFIEVTYSDGYKLAINIAHIASVASKDYDNREKNFTENTAYTQNPALKSVIFLSTGVPIFVKEPYQYILQMIVRAESYYITGEPRWESNDDTYAD